LFYQSVVINKTSSGTTLVYAIWICIVVLGVWGSCLFHGDLPH